MPEKLGKLRAGLEGRYEIEREIGRGGMATVYRALDTQHDRPVALKLLHPELAASLGSDRFQREIRLAARLQHPHILGVYDSGDADGSLWFTMPFVEGQSLRDRLDRERQLPVADALRIAREIALALDYAHRQGVIHRDIKPENILLVDGHAMVADFGIARALHGNEDESLTHTGTVIGTPAYMSPEQAAGDSALDTRSDIYSLACVLYEMLAGEPPFRGPTLQAVIARVLSEQPPTLDTLRQTISPALAAVVVQAMAKTPADRPATAAEFARLLESSTPVSGVHVAAHPTRSDRVASRSGLMVAAAATVVLGVAVLAVALRPRGEAASGERRIAVLPFENAGSADDEYFADGITDEVRSRLSTLQGLRVTARGSSSQYKRSPKSPRDIGRELGVQYLLAGTVRWMKGNGIDRVRVTPELIDVERSESRWSQPYDTVLSDVFAVQASIASQVATALNIALADTARARIARPSAANLDAYDEYLKGEQITHSLGSSDIIALARGVEHYERAVQLDSTYVLAWAAVARARGMINATSPTTEGAERVRVAAERTLQLAPDRAEARLAMGAYLRDKLDYAGAREQFLEGLRHDPNNVDLLNALISVEASLGQFDDARAHAAEAAALDPRSVASARLQAVSLHDVRQYPEELAAWDRTLALAPDNLTSIQGKSVAFLALGQLDSVHAMLHGLLTTGTVDTTALLVRFSLYQEMMWALPRELWPKILDLKVADFGGDKGHWGLKLGHTYRLLGDTTRARMFGDTARLAFETQLRAFPDRAQLHELVGRALALGGHRKEAIEAADRSLALRQTTMDAGIRPYIHFQVARILIQSGEYDRALDLIEPLLTSPASDLTPAYLRLDPTFQPLMSNPRFRRLLKSVG